LTIVYPLFYSVEIESTQETLNKELKQIADGLGIEIIELSLKRASNRLIVRILVDKAGGINIDECALINKSIGSIVEEKELIPQRYLLEVSSPGLDRPLKTKDDFQRMIGKDVEVWLQKPVDDRSFVSARVKAVSDDRVLLEDKDALQINIAYTAIARARLLIKI